MGEMYWIAINGASCAIASAPMKNPKVTPTPQQLLGFPTFEAAKHAQTVCLTAPMGEVVRFLQSLAHERQGRPHRCSHAFESRNADARAYDMGGGEHP